MSKPSRTQLAHRVRACKKGYDMANWTFGALRRSRRPALLLLVLGTLVAYQGGSSFIGAEAQEPRQKLKAGVESLAAGGTFWVLMHEEANLAPALELRGDVERGTFVYQKLNEVANRSQADLRQWLDDR